MINLYAVGKQSGAPLWAGGPWDAALIFAESAEQALSLANDYFCEHWQTQLPDEPTVKLIATDLQFPTDSSHDLILELNGHDAEKIFPATPTAVHHWI